MKNKKILIIIFICIGIILLSTSLAFFASTKYNNNVIGQNSLANIEDTIKLEIDETYKKDGLVPIKEEYVTRAAQQECVDDLGNPSCSMYKVKVTNTAEVAQKIHLTLNIEKNTFENYRLLIYKGSKIKKPITDPIILPQNEIIQKKLEGISTTLLPEQSVIYNLVYYVNNIYDNTNDMNQQFLASISVNTEVSGDYTGTGLGEPDEDIIPVDLASGLVPIYYNDDNKWEITTIDDENWYNYEEQKWANAVILKNAEDNVVGNELTLPDGSSITESQSNVYAMFVWIPRFSYTIGCISSSCLGYKVEEASALSTSTPGAIDIKFVSKEDKLEIPDMDNGIYPNYTYTNETDRTPTNYYTHPAFWWDKNGDGVRPEDNSEELAGIWVGKFETSVDSTSTCYTSMSSSNCLASVSNVTPRILPNVMSLRLQTVYNQFETANKFSASGNIYGIDNAKTDSHMMKNSEWSAVAYLSQSIYGKYGNSTYSGTNKEIYINNYDSNYTGISAGAPSTSSSGSITCRYNVIADRGSGTGACGTGASTTGNIYGIYDMSGGAFEYVMGNYNNTVSSSGIASSWFTTTSNKKYYDKFTTTSPFTTKNKQTIGQSLYEVAGWYGDNNKNFSSKNVWLTQGGDFGSTSYAGAFNSVTSDGKAYSNYGFRSVFVMTIA